MMKIEGIFYRGIMAVFVLMVFSAAANAQLLGKKDYGVGVTVAIYQFDDTRSQKFTQVNTLKETVST
ncbi:MAG: hypothetical protein J2P31_09320, partial [Blastocatellia bacterium]|nr:hypothetical protein [Blastocatellia bacterium]